MSCTSRVRIPLAASVVALAAAAAVALPAAAFAAPIPVSAADASPWWNLTADPGALQPDGTVEFLLHVRNISDEGMGGLSVDVPGTAANPDCRNEYYLAAGDEFTCTVDLPMSAGERADGVVVRPFEMRAIGGREEKQLDEAVTVIERWTPPVPLPVVTPTPIATPTPKADLVPTPRPVLTPTPTATPTPKADLVPTPRPVLTPTPTATPTATTPTPRALPGASEDPATDPAENTDTVATDAPTVAPLATTTTPAAAAVTPAVTAQSEAAHKNTLAITGGSVDLVWPIVGAGALAGGLALLAVSRRRGAKAADRG
ncbi:hypothetical protein N3K63_13365 [Microbacterium sp. W1N]|uniref:hypothetical protein n=1 Tax=Microbacterium festucae TaxID=2977531 RepID=UPI0021C045BB|nr:hypothetical protein [Microbacterium festucae]MCT9821268.1 hypothetical protein [Microbacterium festucae]